MMGGISIWQILTIIFGGIIPAWAIVKIIGKTGYSRWWALLMLLPIANVVMIWVLATVHWPKDK
ncbi:hypothetical protein LCE44_07410 [Vibrio harveyi]|uniref:hypothetical protein n=1 Tax=Vibrio harveyi TaxID=669 RepID=UPI0027F23342|nr:hypothetical protein [Vibrio harveyi]EKY4195911.1 hypothetical protein [Vibrio harveyi]